MPLCNCTHTVLPHDQHIDIYPIFRGWMTWVTWAALCCLSSCFTNLVSYPQAKAYPFGSAVFWWLEDNVSYELKMGNRLNHWTVHDFYFHSLPEKATYNSKPHVGLHSLSWQTLAKCFTQQTPLCS